MKSLREEQINITAALAAKIDVSSKDASGGVVGLTLLKINFKNVANTFTSFFTNSNTTARTYTFADKDGAVLLDSDKDVTGGVAGLTLFKLNLRNVANTITSWITNAATAARTWTMPDKDGTVAMTSDLPLPNYLHNGRWLIDQVNEGGVYTVNAATVQCMDGVRCYGVAAAGGFTVNRATDPDNAALKACKIICTVADTSLAAADRYMVGFPLEGSAVTDLRIGTARAETITLYFNATFPAAGTYGIALGNDTGLRSYVTTITVPNAVENPYSVTVRLDTAGTWLYADGVIGLIMYITLATGSNFVSSSTDAWATTTQALTTTSAQTNFMATVNNTIHIKEIRLVKGTSAGGEQTENKAQALARCRRHLRKSSRMYGSAMSATGIKVVEFLGEPMMKAPVVTLLTTSPYTESPWFIFVVTPAGTAAIDADLFHIDAKTIAVKISGYTGLVAGTDVELGLGVLLYDAQL